jgi:2-dehydropantoate 2-reductase
MRIVVLGTGGVGGYFGGRLAHAGKDVTFIARGVMLDALRTRGLRVDSINGDLYLPNVNATDDPSSIGKVDAVLVCVKSWQVREAVESICPAIGDDAIIVPLENGMEAPDDIAAAAGREHAAGGLCGLVSFVIAPGHVRHISVDPFIAFGELHNRRTPRADRLLEALTSSGLTAFIPPDIHRAMWMKFLFISTMSSMGSITRSPAGVWRVLPETRAMAEAALREVMSVATARGMALPDDAFATVFQRIDGLTPDSTASLQRDIMDGKPSELDAQLGAVVRMGRASGAATPLFEFMYDALLPQERKARGEI